MALIASSPYNFRKHRNIIFSDIYRNPTSGDLYTVVADTSDATQSYGKIYKSLDDGATWSEVVQSYTILGNFNVRISDVHAETIVISQTIDLENSDTYVRTLLLNTSNDTTQEILNKTETNNNQYTVKDITGLVSGYSFSIDANTTAKFSNYFATESFYEKVMGTTYNRVKYNIYRADGTFERNMLWAIGTNTHINQRAIARSPSDTYAYVFHTESSIADNINYSAVDIVNNTITENANLFSSNVTGVAGSKYPLYVKTYVDSNGANKIAYLLGYNDGLNSATRELKLFVETFNDTTSQTQLDPTLGYVVESGFIPQSSTSNIGSVVYANGTIHVFAVNSTDNKLYYKNDKGALDFSTAFELITTPTGNVEGVSAHLSADGTKVYYTYGINDSGTISVHFGVRSLDSTPPATPTGLAGTAGDKYVDLTWDANTETDLAGYNVYKSTDNTNFTKDNSSLITTNSYQSSGLTPETTYYFKVSAVDTSTNESTKSSAISVLTLADTTAPSTPTGLTGTSNHEAVDLSWNANTESDLSGYNVYRSTDDVSFTKVNASVITGTSYTDTGLVNGTLYYHRITALDSYGNESSQSTSVSTTPTALYKSGSGTSTDPYLIETLTHLDNVRKNLTSYFKQVADIDASGTSTWNSDGSGGYYGFDPIARYASSSDRFRGVYDGNGFEVLGLYINRPSTQYNGLFGYVYDGTIRNLSVANVDIKGGSYTGALVGHTSSTGGLLEKCNSTGTVTTQDSNSTPSDTGGLVGGGKGEIKNCYSLASVSSNGDEVGGLAGSISATTVTNSYSAGLVSTSMSSPTYIGGLVGSSFDFASASDCFWDTEASGQTSSALGTGKTTSEMKTQSTYTNWNFVDIWDIDSSRNNGYPSLQVFLSKSISISGGIISLSTLWNNPTLATQFNPPNVSAYQEDSSSIRLDW